MYYYKPDDNSCYFTTNKNGSTVLAEIAEKSGQLKNLNLESCIDIISKDNSTIRIPFRDPFPRFVSGLSVNLHNCTEGEFGVDLGGNTANFTLSVHYNNFLRYFYHSVFGPSTVFERDTFIGYHLFDKHLDHWLYVPLILLYYGYNVELIPMYELSDHLMVNFIDCNQVIKDRERKNSFNEIHKELIPFWQAYKHRMIDHANFSCSWDHWMDPEIKIFEELNRQYKSPADIDAGRLVDYTFDNKFYFGDFYSPKIFDLMELLKSIHKHKTPDDRFLMLTKTFYNFLDARKSAHF